MHKKIFIVLGAGAAVAAFMVSLGKAGPISCTVDELDYSYSKYLAAAEAGDTCAMYNIGEIYHRGKGVEVNDAEAVRWYTQAAKNGLATAQTELGYRHLYNWRMPNANRSEGIEWYETALNQGDPIAHYQVGEIYRYGHWGFPKDAQKAAELYKFAAENDHSGAQLQLGYMYAEGNGVPQDFANALQWMQRGGDDLGTALNRISYTFFSSGDYNTSKQWLERAVAQGSPEARIFLDKFDEKVRTREAAQNRPNIFPISETSGFDILLGLIAFGVALNSISPDQSHLSDDQRQRAYEAEQARIQRGINTDLAIGWALSP